MALEKAKAVDDDLRQWSKTIRDSWKFRTVHGDRVSRHPEKYWKYVHVYNNMWICRVWNQFRTARIKLQATLLQLMSWAHYSHGTNFVSSDRQARECIQAMADDVCASVPYCLGEHAPLEQDAHLNISKKAEGQPSPLRDDPPAQSRALGWFLCLVPVSHPSIVL